MYYPWDEAFEDLFKENNLPVENITPGFWEEIADIVDRAISEMQEIESHRYPSTSDIRDDYWKRKMDNAKYEYEYDLKYYKDENKDLESENNRLRWIINDLRRELGQFK